MLRFRRRLLESAVGKPFVQEHISVASPVQHFDPVSSPAAEQEQAFLIQMTAELLGHNRSQSVNPQAQVRIAADDEVIADFAQIDHND